MAISKKAPVKRSILMFSSKYSPLYGASSQRAKMQKVKTTEHYIHALLIANRRWRFAYCLLLIVLLLVPISPTFALACPDRFHPTERFCNEPFLIF